MSTWIGQDQGLAGRQGRVGCCTAWPEHLPKKLESKLPCIGDPMLTPCKAKDHASSSLWHYYHRKPITNAYTVASRCPYSGFLNSNTSQVAQRQGCL